MEDTGQHTTGTVTQAMRVILIVIGLIIFVVVAGEGVSQANDPKYVEGQPHAYPEMLASLLPAGVSHVSTVAAPETVPIPAVQTASEASPVPAVSTPGSAPHSEPRQGAAYTHRPNVPSPAAGYANAHRALERHFDAHVKHVSIDRSIPRTLEAFSDREVSR